MNRFWPKKKPASTRIQRIDSLIGATACALLATLAAFLFRPYAGRGLLPLAFIVVLMLVSRRYGVAAGVIGAVAAALIFAYFSPPMASVRVADATVRGNLAWMLLLGIPASYFVATPKQATGP